VHVLRDILERANGFFACVTLEKAEVGQFEQRDRRQESLGGARAEELARFVENEERDELTLVAESAHTQPSGFAERRHLEQSGELVARLTKVDELAADCDRGALPGRQMVERRLELGAAGRVSRCEQSLAQHAASFVEADQGQLGEAVDFGQGLPERLECSVGSR
jgi:hypothetical protein